MALCALTTPEKSTHTPPALLEAAVILHGMCDIVQYVVMQCAIIIIHTFYQTFFFLELNCTLYQPYCRIYLKGITCKAATNFIHVAVECTLYYWSTYC